MAETLLAAHQHDIETLTLAPSSGGVFEVEFDDHLAFSKKETGRHTSPEEVVELFEAHM